MSPLLISLLLTLPMRGSSGNAGPNRLCGRLPVLKECSTTVLEALSSSLMVFHAFIRSSLLGPARREGGGHRKQGRRFPPYL